MTERVVSSRAEQIAAATPFRLLWSYVEAIDYFRRRENPNVCDFTFGDPHEMASPAYVSAIQQAVVPLNESWFAYKWYEPPAQQAAAESLSRRTGLSFAAEDILLTTGGFTALTVGMKLVADPGDEIIFSLPPWFCYEALSIEAGLAPVKVRVDPETLDLDVDAIEAAITPRTRVVIVNSPNNPTGRIYSPEILTGLAAVLEEASIRHQRRIFILSDEPYNRIIFDETRFHTPAEYYPDTLIAYSYGKTLLAPGQRIGYLALPPALQQRDALRRAGQDVQVAIGFAFPNAVMQYALPELEKQSIDIGRLQKRRDFMVDALTDLGYQVHRPQGTFYLFPRTPGNDDEAFARTLADLGVLILPGTVFEMTGFFRLCLTATDETCQRALPAFAAAIRQSDTM